MANSEYYMTSDLGLAAFLVYHKMTLLGAAKTDSPRHQLVFEDTEDREQLVESFTEDGQVVAKRYAACIHSVNKELKNPVGGVDV